MSTEIVGEVRHSRAILLASTIVLCLLVLPLLVAFVTIGWRFLFNLLAADSMYYMGIANNWVKFGFPTFDGEQITNGFHPLWEMLLAGIFWVFGVSSHNQLYVTVALSLVFVLASLALLGSIAIRYFGVVRGTTGILIMFPGAYTLLGNPDSRASHYPGVLYRLEPWSAINGMESTLSLALWSLAIYFLVRRLDMRGQKITVVDRSCDWTYVFSYPVRVVLTAIVLARLDDAIVLAPIAIVVSIFNSGTIRQRIHQVSQILLLPVVALAVYTLVNTVATGAPLPTSGTSKTGLSLATNFPMLAETVLGVARQWNWIAVAVRTYPLIFCIALSSISIVILNTILKELRNAARLYQLTLILLLYVLMKSLFFITFVEVYSQGYWYNFVTVLLLNFIIAIILVRMIPVHGIYKYAALIVAAMVTILALGTEGHMMSSREWKTIDSRSFNEAEIGYSLWIHEREIREAFSRRDPSAKLIDNLDGAYGFLLDLPAASVTGLPSGKKDLEERQRVGFWNSVLSRGYSIIGSVGYIHPMEEQGVKFREFYRSPDGEVVFFQAISAESIGTARRSSNRDTQGR